MATKRWTEEEEQYLKENYKDMTNSELAKKFGVTKISIQRKLSRLGLIRQQQKKWTPDEEDFLIANYEKMSDIELSEKFEVTVVSIKRKLNRLKLKRKKGKAADKGVKSTASATSKVTSKNVKEKAKVEKTVPAKLPKTKTTKKKTAEIKTKENKAYKSLINKYDPAMNYDVGDEFMHEKWKEKGKVTERFETTFGTSIIVVDFKSSGRKKLVCNVEQQ